MTLSTQTLTAAVGLLVSFASVAHETGRYDPLPCTDDQVQVMVLGSYHMSNPGLDAIHRETDDVLSDRRQAEIVDVVERLSRFSPDKMLVEAPYVSPVVPDRYDAWLKGEYELGRNEIYQIGFRVARALGHDSVYPIDYPMFQDTTALEFYQAYHPEVKKAASEMQSVWQGLAKAEDKRLRSSTVAEYLHHVNDPELWSFGLDSRDVLQTSIRNVQFEQYAGADLLTSWYKRNLRMLANIHRSLDEDDSRALLLVGYGHNMILWNLIDTSPLLCRIDAREYLLE